MTDYTGRLIYLDQDSEKTSLKKLYQEKPELWASYTARQRDKLQVEGTEQEKAPKH